MDLIFVSEAQLIKAARPMEHIIKGGHPAEISVEVTSKIALVINPRAAKALRLMIAPDVMYGTT